MTENKVYRKQHCSWSDKAEALLKEKGISYDTHTFKTTEEMEAFKAKYNVKTTPQVFLNGERVGGYTDLASHFGVEPKVSDKKSKSYKPVIAVFSVAALMAFATRSGIMGFMGFSLSLLACLKLMDIPSFVQGFQKYDLVTQKLKAYGSLYPFLELIAGIGFLAGVAPIFVGSLSALVGLLGVISVFNAVYIQKLDLNCACVGGNANVPLGIISFTENLMMLLMGLALIFNIQIGI